MRNYDNYAAAADVAGYRRSWATPQLNNNMIMYIT